MNLRSYLLQLGALALDLLLLALPVQPEVHRHVQTRQRVLDTVLTLVKELRQRHDLVSVQEIEVSCDVIFQRFVLDS